MHSRGFLASFMLHVAQWLGYTDQVEKELPTEYSRKSARRIEKILRKTILKSARIHVGKKKLESKNKPCFTKEIKDKIKERNMLRKEIVNEPREEWIRLCR